MEKKAIISGITGQDGSYLAELLLEKGYEVHGIVRRVALEDPQHRLWRLRSCLDRVTLHAASLESYASLFKVVAKIQPDECYHLASQSFVSYAFEDEFSTLNININGTLYMLSTINEIVPDCRVYFAGSSEMFGNANESPQSESTPFNPRSPYGISKLTGFHLARTYRRMHGLHVSTGILFNHESPRRGFEFVTRKITHAAARIKAGLQKEVRLGNLDAKRDWGFAKEYVEAMWIMLQKDQPDDYVIATCEEHSVREFAEQAFKHVGLNWEDHVVVDPAFVRPVDTVLLKGAYSKAKQMLDWQPRVKFEQLVEMMVETDQGLVKRLPVDTIGK